MVLFYSSEPAWNRSSYLGFSRHSFYLNLWFWRAWKRFICTCVPVILSISYMWIYACVCVCVCRPTSCQSEGRWAELGDKRKQRTGSWFLWSRIRFRPNGSSCFDIMRTRKHLVRSCQFWLNFISSLFLFSPPTSLRLVRFSLFVVWGSLMVLMCGRKIYFIYIYIYLLWLENFTSVQFKYKYSSGIPVSVELFLSSIYK